jgi:hypothetical protein
MARIASSPSGLRAKTTIRAPATRYRSDIALPIPVLAPVMTATFPSSTLDIPRLLSFGKRLVERASGELIADIGERDLTTVKSAN